MAELIVSPTLIPTSQFLHTVPHIVGHKLKGEVCLWSAVDTGKLRDHFHCSLVVVQVAVHFVDNCATVLSCYGCLYFCVSRGLYVVFCLVIFCVIFMFLWNIASVITTAITCD